MYFILLLSEVCLVKCRFRTTHHYGPATNAQVPVNCPRSQNLAPNASTCKEHTILQNVISELDHQKQKIMKLHCQSCKEPKKDQTLEKTGFLQSNRRKSMDMTRKNVDSLNISYLLDYTHLECLTPSQSMVDVQLYAVPFTEIVIVSNWLPTPNLPGLQQDDIEFQRQPSQRRMASDEPVIVNYIRELHFTLTLFNFLVLVMC